MIQKLEILDETLNSLDYINNKRFSSEKFKEVNSQFEKILMELKSNEETLKINKSSQEFINMFNNILNKIDMLEAKNFTQSKSI
jgi:hypothetical protein